MVCCVMKGRSALHDAFAAARVERRGCTSGAQSSDPERPFRRTCHAERDRAGVSSTGEGVAQARPRPDG